MMQWKILDMNDPRYQTWQDDFQLGNLAFSLRSKLLGSNLCPTALLAYNCTWIRKYIATNIYHLPLGSLANGILLDSQNRDRKKVFEKYCGGMKIFGEERKYMNG